jgi:hypothetical protein
MVCIATLAPYITLVWAIVLSVPKAMREARQMDKADIVPTPYFLSAFFWGLGELKYIMYENS